MPHFLAELVEEERRGSVGADADERVLESSFELSGESAQHEAGHEPDDVQPGSDGD